PAELSFVVPLYNEEENLPELRRRLTPLLDQYSAEAVLVDDGSRDRTAELMDELAGADPRFRAVHLSRNFGHQAAVAAGLQYSRGRAVVVMDADLQDPPELVPQLVEKWREGFEVVYARRAGREREGAAKRLLAWAYYRI